jgi:hypothetical protein
MHLNSSVKTAVSKDRTQKQFYAKPKTVRIVWTMPGSMGSGSVPVGMARAAGARARRVRASVRLRAIFLDMGASPSERGIALKGRLWNLSDVSVYLVVTRRIRHVRGPLSAYLLIQLSDRWNINADPFARRATNVVAYTP